MAVEIRKLEVIYIEEIDEAGKQGESMLGKVTGSYLPKRRRYMIV